MMVFSKHPKLYFLLLNFLVAILLIFLLGVFVMSSLDKYTMHGYTISVPAFYNLSFQEAQQLAERKQLKVMIVDSLYDENALPGTVQEQYPQSGAQVKANRMIQLTVNASGPEQIVFPNLNNSSYRQTLQTLKSLGFKIGKIEYAPSEFKNLVLILKYQEQEIEAGTPVKKGATIDIVLGSGSNGDNYVPLPCFYKMKLNEAITVLQENYLNLGEIIPDNSIQNGNDRFFAIIYQQDPPCEENTTLPAGTPVNLYLTLDKKKLEALDSLQMEEINY